MDKGKNKGKENGMTQEQQQKPWGRVAIIRIQEEQARKKREEEYQEYLKSHPERDFGSSGDGDEYPEEKTEDDEDED